jgi:aerobic carbon-monoxide dehydrogenase small subunit
MSQHLLRTTVNGMELERLVMARRRLADFLREDLGLTGTKVSCEVQVCGVCTVLVDGVPVSSCTYLAIDVDGCSVTTIEGLATEDGLSPVQAAFVRTGAIQCGFCTPGFVLAVTALLKEIPQPTDAEVRAYLEGNLCRCSGYQQILDAVALAVARQEAGQGG